MAEQNKTATLTLADMGLVQPATQAPAGSTRPQAQVWMNVGYNVEVEDANGIKQDRFVSLPLGIALDTMEPRSMPSGNNRDYANLVAAQNQLLEVLQKAGADLDAGETQMVNLQIQLRKVSDPQEVDNGDNPYIKAFSL